MNLDLRAVAANIRKAETEDLLDRVTVYRDGMEPAAVDLIEGELSRRGLSPEEIAEHDRRRREEVVFRDEGTVVKCSFCHGPAVWVGWGWHRLWGWVPVFPRILTRCERHRPHSVTEATSPPAP
jgi:hypothetical protein